MTSERRNECLRAIRGYIRRFVPPGEFLDDCFTLLDNMDNVEVLVKKVEDGIDVRENVARRLGLKPEDEDRSDIMAWYALPNIYAAIEKMKGKIVELNKQIEEANIARAQDHQRLIHYEGALADKGTDMQKLDEQMVSAFVPKFPVGARVIYDLGHNGTIQAKVIRNTRKRVLIQLKGRGWSGMRYVMAKSLTIDPNPPVEE